MKKSKIILPAIALLAVSGIASVTGTVAWFTAAQSASVNLSNIVAMNTTGNLTAEFKKVSTSTDSGYVEMYGFAPATTSAATAISGSFASLRDASYDMYNNRVYSAIFDSTSTTETSGTIVGYNEVAHGANIMNENGVSVYYAVEFTVTFTVAHVGENDKYSLFFNAKDSAMTSTSKIAPAFRVAMVSNDEQICWAPKADTASTGFDYVKGTDASTGVGKYTVGTDALVTDDNVYNTNTVATGNDKTTLCLANKSITKAANTVDVHFAFWFDGNDSECIASKVDGVVSSLAMSFYAVLNPAA